MVPSGRKWCRRPFDATLRGVPSNPAPQAVPQAAAHASESGLGGRPVFGDASAGERASDQDRVVLRLQDVRKSYLLGPVRAEVLHGVSLTLEEGELVSIMGPSGCGKSTLMNVAGLLDRPTTGACLLRGRDAAGMSDDERAAMRNAHIGFVFQSFHLLGHLTAAQNAGLPLVYRGIPNAEIRERARAALKRVGMGEWHGHLPSQLSGGQQQRIAVARALVGDPAVLLADEPTGALDPATGDEIMALFEMLSRQGVAVVVVTHNAEVAARCHRQTRMTEGLLVETTPDAQRGGGAMHESVSGSPPTRGSPAGTSTAGGLALREQLRFNAREAGTSLRSVLARSALALVGIVVGIGAVIAMVSTGQIVRAESLKQFQELGTDIVTIRRQFTRVRGRVLDIGLADVERLPGAVPAVESAAAAVDSNTPIRYRGRPLGPGMAFGVTGAFFDLSRLAVAEGRLVSDLDRHRFHCVAGARIAQGIRDAGAVSPIGERIRVFGRLCTVVGVLESVPPLAVGRNLVPDDTVFLPIIAAMRAGAGGIRNAVARAREGVEPETAQREVQVYFGRVRPELKVAVTTAGQLIARMRSQGQLFTLLLGAIASISLIVGGVGVMNVMLLSIRERRREIGLRRAVGARRSDVQQQFVIESSALALVGGALGVVLGVAAAWGICRYAGWPFAVSTTAVTVGVAVAAAVGVFFGLYPAYRAAKLDPIEALRS